MDSENFAKYIEATEGISKPWLLIQLRLHKLQERRLQLTEEAYFRELAELQQELMNLGEWWIGIEGEVFGTDR